MSCFLLERSDGCLPCSLLIDGLQALGTRELPVRVFVEPDTNVLLQANTNAGGTLRQVAFDAAVMRHLGSSLYCGAGEEVPVDARTP